MSNEALGRRRFIKTAGGAAATTLALGSCGSGGGPPEDIYLPHPAAVAPRTGRFNPFVTADGRPLLVSVEGEDFATMLRQGIEALGGLQRLITAHENVLLKPNLSDAEEYPGASRDSSIAAVINEIRAVTTGTVSVGDEGWRPGPEVYTRLDLQPTVESAGGVLTTFTDTYRVWGLDWSDEKPDLWVYTAAYDAPVILNLCNLKRHDIAGYSCAIKNTVGAVAGSGYEATRGHLHEASGDFLGTLTEIAACIKPELHIVDAQSVLTQRGPFMAWGGVPVEANRLIICGDMVATDAYCVRLLEALDDSFVDPGGDTVTQRLAQLGLGEVNLNGVQILEITA